jgi:hypothetical protein
VGRTKVGWGRRGGCMGRRLWVVMVRIV